MSTLLSEHAVLLSRTVYSDNADSKMNGTIADNGDYDKAPLVWGVTMTFWLLAMIVVAIRMYARMALTRFRGQDDLWMLVACAFSTGDQILKILWIEHGLGKHFSAVTLTQFAVFAKVGYSISLLYPWTLGLVKISVLTFYLRLFPHETFRKGCYIMIAFVGSMTLALSLAQTFSCSPISDSWSLAPVGHCVNKPVLQYSGSILNAVTDLIILVMPMKFFFTMTMDNKSRWSVIGLFSLGIVTCVASVLRLLTIHRFYSGQDPTWDATNIAIWSCIEINLTIIIASLPAIKPVIMLAIVNPIRDVLGFPNTRSTTYGKSSRSTEFSDMTNTMNSNAARRLGSTRQNSLNDLEAGRMNHGSGLGHDDADDSNEMDFFAMLRASNAADNNRADNSRDPKSKNVSVINREVNGSISSAEGADNERQH